MTSTEAQLCMLGHATAEVGDQNHRLWSILELYSLKQDVTSMRRTLRVKLHYSDYAARGGNPNALGLLAEVTKQSSLNASIDLPDHNGRTALHDAVRSGVLESVQILLNASANPNARDFKGKSCLHIASECSEEQNIMDLQRLSQQNSLAECARHPADRKKRDYTGHPAGLKFVDSWRPVLTKKEEDGKIKPSRLDLEGFNRMTDIVRLLLDAGSDPNITDDNGMSPYDAAIASGCNEIAWSLSASRDTSELSSITASAEQGQERKTLPSLKHNIWLRERNSRDEFIPDISPDPGKVSQLLLPAIQSGEDGIVRGLLKKGADPLKQLTDGKTVLHTVARNGLLSITKLLVHGKQTQSVPSDLIHEAIRRERPNMEMIKYLVQLSVDLNAKQDKGKGNRYYRRR